MDLTLFASSAAVVLALPHLADDDLCHRAVPFLVNACEAMHHLACVTLGGGAANGGLKDDDDNNNDSGGLGVIEWATTVERVGNLKTREEAIDH